MRGTITQLVLDRGFGFIRGEDGRDYFFHRSALQGIEFDELAEGMAVIFDVKEHATGDERGEHPRAVGVRLPAEELPAVDNTQLPPQKVNP